MSKSSIPVSAVFTQEKAFEFCKAVGLADKAPESHSDWLPFYVLALNINAAFQFALDNKSERVDSREIVGA